VLGVYLKKNDIFKLIYLYKLGINMKCQVCEKKLSINKFDKNLIGEYYKHCQKCKIEHRQFYHKNKKIKNSYCVVCLENKIIKRAIYGFLEDKKSTHCSEHQENMFPLYKFNNECIRCLF
jgi:hypothetical protein